MLEPGGAFCRLALNNALHADTKLVEEIAFESGECRFEQTASVSQHRDGRMHNNRLGEINGCLKNL